MARINIVDEVDQGTVADVVAGGGLSVADCYSTAFVNSGTASGYLVTAPCYLHTVNIATSAADAQLLLGDSTDASAVSNDTSAGLVAKFDLSKRGTYLFDCIIANKLAYRLTSLDCDGISVTYQLLS